MTDDYKKNLLDYMTKLLNQEDPYPRDFWITYEDMYQYKDSFSDFFDELNNKALFLKITGILENEKYDVSILYGSYITSDTTASLRGRGFLIYLDKNYNVIDVLFKDKYDNYLRGFHKLYFDESSNRVYGVCGHPTATPVGMNEPNYFCYIKNLFLKNNEDKYEFDINTSYNLNENDIYVREIVKNPDSASYLMIGTNTRSEENIRVIQYTINVGESDVIKKWNVINYGVYGGYYWNYVEMLAYYLWFNGDTPHFKVVFGGLNYNSSQTTLNGKYYGLATDNGDNVSYTRLSKMVDILSPYSGTMWKFGDQLEVLSVDENEIYFVVVYENAQEESGEIVNYYETRIHKFDGSSVSTIYTSPFFRGTASDGHNHDCEYFNFYKDTDGTIYLVRNNVSSTFNSVYVNLLNFTLHYNEINDSSNYWYAQNYSYEGGDRIYSSFTILQRNYNISKIFNIIGDVSNITFTQENLTGYILVLTNLFNLDNYNGGHYIDKDFFVPKLVNLYSGADIVFSRNIYNISIQNNTTMSSVEVPNTYLNDLTIDDNSLVGKTLYQLNRDVTNWNKNIYETVDISFINTLDIIDEDTNTTYELPAIKLNNSITNGGDTNYLNTPCTKYRINYNDNTNYVGSITWYQLTPFSRKTVFNVSITKDVYSIDLISNDETTVYMTINDDFEIGKNYQIEQKVRIGEKPKSNKLLYNSQNVLYNNDEVQVYQ